MVEKAIVFIGHSHLNPIRDGLTRLSPVEDAPGTRARFYVHNVWAKNAQDADSDPAGGVAFNPDVLSLINATVPANMARHYVSVLGGNGHIVLALSKHPEPFDFVLPESPTLPLEVGAELIPFEYFLETLKPFLMPYVWQMIAFRQAIGERIICVETPPPYGDDAYVASHLGSYVPDPNNVVSRYLRYKAWRAHSHLLRIFCEAHDVEFLPAPAESVDEEGFIKPEAYGSDATHANWWYGQLVARQIEQRFGVVYSGWQLFS